jgi:hypothetical protein
MTYDSSSRTTASEAKYQGNVKKEPGLDLCLLRTSNFFLQELSRFKFTLETPKKWKARGPRLNIPKIIETAGDLLVEHASLLETVTGLS